jgi:hypothetical protein
MTVWKLGQVRLNGSLQISTAAEWLSHGGKNETDCHTEEVRAAHEHIHRRGGLVPGRYLGREDVDRQREEDGRADDVRPDIHCSRLVRQSSSLNIGTS